MGYVDYLKWQLSQIGRKRSKDMKVLEKFKSLWKEKKESTNQASSSSSLRTQPPEEFFSQARERASVPEL